MVQARPRIDSKVSEKEIAEADKESCILCFNEITFFALGSCSHTAVCAKCSLRIRLLMDDKNCTLCKQELNEIVITSDRSLTWKKFDDRVRHDCDQDRADDSIFYTDRPSKIEGMKLRTLTCLISNCSTKQTFANQESLRRHMETVHQKTFCLVCLKGRTVFIREQRIYHMQKLRMHIEHGDPASDRGAEILPHPWCDFCEYFFDGSEF